MKRFLSLKLFHPASLALLALLINPWQAAAQQRTELRLSGPSVSTPSPAGTIDPAAELEREIARGASLTVRFQRTDLDTKAEAIAEVVARGQVLLVRVRAANLPLPARWKEQRYSLWVDLQNYGQKLYIGDLPVIPDSESNELLSARAVEGGRISRGRADTIIRFKNLPRGAVIGGLILTAEPARYGPIINEPLRPLLIAQMSEPVSAEPPAERATSAATGESQQRPTATAVALSAASAKSEPASNAGLSPGAEAYNKTGLSHYEAGRYREAAEAYQHALRLAPADALIYNNLGTAYSALGQFKEAVEAFKQAIRLQPEMAIVRLNLGHAYCQLKQHGEALKTFKQAISLQPGMAQAYYGSGLAFYSLRRYKEAIESFRQALHLEPQIAEAHYGLALAYQELKDTDSLMNHYRILQKLDPELARKLAQTFPTLDVPCRRRLCQ
ncbi:MAG TPA: tetratricopeptide repeat protein [Pyrinomonadaceae bacterium]|nr:tetratricopeptide repeat protein [Pyrinomonadaceae bacterium]